MPNMNYKPNAYSFKTRSEQQRKRFSGLSGQFCEICKREVTNASYKFSQGRYKKNALPVMSNARAVWIFLLRKEGVSNVYYRNVTCPLFYEDKEVTN